MKYLQKCFSEIYLGNNNITTDGFFIISNIRIDCQMYADEFQGLLYNILSEQPFKNQLIHITEEKYGYTISDYVVQNFGMLIGEKMTCISCHKTKRPKVLKYD